MPDISRAQYPIATPNHPWHDGHLNASHRMINAIYPCINITYLYDPFMPAARVSSAAWHWINDCFLPQNMPARPPSGLYPGIHNRDRTSLLMWKFGTNSRGTRWLVFQPPVAMFRAVPGFRPYRYGPGRSRIARAVAELQGRSGMPYISLRAYVI